MTLRYGIDTSVLVRLITTQPEAEYLRCRAELARMVERENARLLTPSPFRERAGVRVKS
jgi:hypothetical protein